MHIIDRFRDRWISYVLYISTNRHPGYIGNVPYLLILRAVAILALTSRFALPFSHWAATPSTIDVLIPSVILILTAEVILIGRATRRPFEPSSRTNKFIAACILVEVSLISAVCVVTGLPTSDFSLFYYLPILTSAEFLPLRYW